MKQITGQGARPKAWVPFVALYATAIALALIGRACIGLLKANGQFFEYYNISSRQPLLKQLCDAIWPEQLVAIVAVAALCVLVIAGTVVLLVRAGDKPSQTTALPLKSTLLWSLAGLLVAGVCLAVVGLALFTPSQTGALGEMAPEGLATVALSAVVALYTLLVASSLSTLACKRFGKGDATRTPVALAVFWTVFAGLTALIVTFTVVAAMGDPIPVGSLHACLWVGVALNVIVSVVSAVTVRKTAGTANATDVVADSASV